MSILEDNLKKYQHDIEVYDNKIKVLDKELQAKKEENQKLNAVSLLNYLF
jgi:hypothetical protein